MRSSLSLRLRLFLQKPPAATTILFNDRTSFLLATGATPVGAIPQNGNTAGILTFGNVPPASVNTIVNWSTLISEPFDLAINGVENVDITSSSSLFSFGFDFHEPSTTTPPGSKFPDTVVVSLQELIRRRRIEELKSILGSVRLEIDIPRSRRRPRRRR